MNDATEKAQGMEQLEAALREMDVHPEILPVLVDMFREAAGHTGFGFKVFPGTKVWAYWEEKKVLSTWDRLPVSTVEIHTIDVFYNNMIHLVDSTNMVNGVPVKTRAWYKTEWPAKDEA